MKKPTTRGERATLRLLDTPVFEAYPVFVKAVGPVDIGIRSEVMDILTGAWVRTRTAGVIHIDGVPHLPATVIDASDDGFAVLVEFPDGPTAWVDRTDTVLPKSIAARKVQVRAS